MAAELFNVLGKFAIEGAREAAADIDSVTDSASHSASSVESAGDRIQRSNNGSGSSWAKLKSAVAEYKSQGLSTSQAWQQATNDMKSSTASAESGISSSLKKVAAAVATYLTVDKLVNFGKACLSMASDVEEMENKFNVVFGDLAEGADEWADSYSSAIGRNKNTIKGYLADNQNMFVGMGMTREQGMKLSQQMVSLGLDLASFNNLSEPDAVNALSKALMGETESAKRLGAVLNDNTLAMAQEQLGYEGKFEKLSEAEKMEVRYQAILMQSADAVGDCERSLDSYKGKQIQLQSATENLKETIGSYLLPIMAKWMGKLTEFVQLASSKVGPAVEWLQDKWGDLGEMWREVIQPALSALGKAFGKVVDALRPVAEEFASLLPKVDSNKSAWDVFRDVCYTVEEVILKVADALTVAAEWMAEHQTAVEVITILLGTLAAAVVAYNVAQTAATAATTIATAATTAFGAVMAFVTSPITLVVVAIGALIAIGVALYKNWDTIKEKAHQLWQNLKDKFEAIRAAAAEKFEAVRQKIEQPIEKAKEKIRSIVDAIKGFFSGMKLELPHIKLPHFTVTGQLSLSPPSVPKLGIDWYSKAMNNPVMFTEPTLFGYNPETGNARGAGETGNEIMLGQSTMISMIRQAMAAENGPVEFLLQRLVDLLVQFFPEALEAMRTPMMMDARGAARAMAPYMDGELGKIAIQRGRGR